VKQIQVARGLVFGLMAALLAGLSLPREATAVEAGVLRVDAAQVEWTINPFVYGANYGPWALVSLDMLDEAKASGVTYLRFPAGNWGDRNDLTPFQIDMFVKQAQDWNAEPSISVRLQNGTPEQAAELVRYANIEKGYGVRYWSIGNEPTLYPDYSVDQLNIDWRAIAEAMKAVDPSIVLMGPEVHQYPSNADPNDYHAPMREWVRGFLEVNADLVDYVSIHRYPFPLSMNAPVTPDDQMRTNPAEWDFIIPDLRQVIRETTGRDIPVAVTEVNSHWSGGSAQLATDMSAVWWADVLGRLIRQKVDIVNFFALYTTSGLGLFGLLDRYDVRPTYYVYQLYQQFGSELVASESPDTDVTITAALREDGALTLMVVNRSAEAKAFTLDLAGFTASGAAEVWLLDAEHRAEAVQPVDLGAGPLTLPSQSVMLLVVPG
jgi:hypothetical protein